MVHVRFAEERDAARWRELFTAYGVFYETAFEPGVLDGVWAWIRDPKHPVRCFVAEDADGRVIGFAHVREQPDTFVAGPGWYLDDLYTAEDARGTGAGTALIDAISAHAAAHGGGTLRWITAADNERAQRVYDRLATRTTWVTYEKEVEKRMQLGTRWAVGDTPPAQLTPEVLAAIHRVEGELLGLDTTDWRWTLTWLEGRPVVQLDDGTTIRVASDGTVHVANEDDELDR